MKNILHLWFAAGRSEPLILDACAVKSKMCVYIFQKTPVKLIRDVEYVDIRDNFPATCVSMK